MPITQHVLDVYKKNCKIKLQTKEESEHRKGKNRLFHKPNKGSRNKSPAIAFIAWNKELEMKWGGGNHS